MGTFLDFLVMKLKGVGGEELLENVFEGENGVSNGAWFSLEILQEFQVHSNSLEREDIFDLEGLIQGGEYHLHQSKELTRYRDDSSFRLGQTLGLDSSTLHETSFLQHCQKCAKYVVQKRGFHPRRNLSAAEPFDVVAIDVATMKTIHSETECKYSCTCRCCNKIDCIGTHGE
jgi:hypothetical protein